MQRNGMANPGPIASIFWLDHNDNGTSSSLLFLLFDPQSQLRL